MGCVVVDVVVVVVVDTILDQGYVQSVDPKQCLCIMHRFHEHCTCCVFALVVQGKVAPYSLCWT